MNSSDHGLTPAERALLARRSPWRGYTPSDGEETPDQAPKEPGSPSISAEDADKKRAKWLWRIFRDGKMNPCR